MGCSASKDGLEANSKTQPRPPSRSNSLPTHSNKSDNGYHMVALTSSTYGILKLDSPKHNGDDRISLSKSSSAADVVYEKLKHFDVPENMVTKPWSEVSLSLPKIPPATRTESPRRLPRKATRSDLETINMWELMDGLDEDGRSPMSITAKLKAPERVLGSPVIKPFERSITFSTIHTLNELDSGDPNMAIAPGPAGNFTMNSKPIDVGGKENTKPIRAKLQPPSSPRVLNLTPSSSSSSPPAVPRLATQSKEFPQLQQPAAVNKGPTPQVAAVIKEVSNVLLPPPSPIVTHSNESPQLHQPAAVLKGPTPRVAAVIKEVSNLILPPPSPVVKPVAAKSATGSQGGSKTSASKQLSSSGVKVVKAPAMTQPIAPSEAQYSRAPQIPQSSKFMANPPSPSLLRATTDIPPGSPRFGSLARALSAQVRESSHDSPRVSSPGRVRAVAAALSQESAGLQSHSASRRPESHVAAHDSSRGVPRFASPIHVLSLAATYDLENQRKSIALSDSKAPPMSPCPATLKGVSQGGKQTLSQHLSMPNPSTKAVSSIEQGNGSRDGLNDSMSTRSAVPGTKSGDWASPKVVTASHSGPKGRGNSPGTSPSAIAANQKTAVRKHKVATAASQATSQGVKGVSPARKGVSPGNGVVDSLKRGSSPGAKSALWTDRIEDSMFDPDLLASFEEALEMFSTDDWYNVRSSDGEAVSNSISQEGDSDSPSKKEGISSRSDVGVSGSADFDAKGNTTSEHAEGAPRRESTSVKSPAPAVVVPAKKRRPNPWEQFEVRCPPAGEDRVVLYTTSLRGIRKTFEDCNNARFIIQSLNVAVDERDVSIHAEFRQELKDLSGKPVPVPQVFIKGRYIGGMDEITRLHEDGTLATLVEGLPAQLSHERCDGCGGVRFVPCSDCSGSCKVIDDANKVVRCSECNENGLMRCPICY